MRPSATGPVSDWTSRGVRTASNVSSGVEPITGSGASVMRYWAAPRQRSTALHPLWGRKGASGEPAGEFKMGGPLDRHGLNTGKRPVAASVPLRLPAGQGCCLRCLRQPHSGHVRDQTQIQDRAAGVFLPKGCSPGRLGTGAVSDHKATARWKRWRVSIRDQEHVRRVQPRRKRAS